MGSRSICFLSGAATSAVAASLLFALFDLPSPRDDEMGETSAVTLLREVADGTDAETAVQDLSDPRLSLAQLRRSGDVGGRLDPVAALLAAATIPGHDNRNAYLAAALGAWAERDGAAAARWVVENFEGSLRGDALYYVADAWAESEPQSAGAWFLENTEGFVRIDALWEVLEAWGRKSPEEAVEWSGTLDEALKWEVVDGLAEGWAAVDPAAAAAHAETLGETAYASDFLRSVARQWAAYDPEAAAEWSRSLKQEEAAEAALVEIGQAWAALHPEAAARWAASETDAGRVRWAQEGIARGWSEHDPTGALEWLLGSPGGGDLREDLVEEVVESWSEIDPSQLANWLDGRPPGAATDLVLHRYSEAILPASPEAALAWANEINDPDSRREQLHRLASGWLSLAGPNAIEAIEGLGLPIDMKAVLGE